MIKKIGRAVQFVARAMGARSGVILMYHRVAEPKFDPWKLSVHPDIFRGQIKSIKSTCEVVPLDGFLDALRRPGERPVVSVTFDDGYMDNAVVAAPILERENCPATIFLATGYIGANTPFWWDKLAQIVLSGDFGDNQHLVVGHDVIDWSSSKAELQEWREAKLAEIYALVINNQKLKCIELVEGLEQKTLSKEPLDPLAIPMTTADIEAIVKNGLTIAAHTNSHPYLPAISPRDAMCEISASRDALQSMQGNISAFSYPYGAANKLVSRMVQSAGFMMGVTTDRGYANIFSNRFRLPRLQVTNISGYELTENIYKLVRLKSKT